MRQRWIVISNCQAFGLANCLETFARDVTCEACDYHDFQQQVVDDPDHFRCYDFALVLPEARDWPRFDPTRLPAHVFIPAFQFAAYHPDSVYVFADGEIFGGGVIAAYHSIITLAAYKEELPPARAAAFFNARLYQSLGFFAHWQPQRDWIVAQFREAGFDVGGVFLRAGRGRPFMHTVNHPTIEAMAEIARAVLTRFDRPVYRDVTLPPDNLAGTRWPVYPEIGERLGIAGAYLFKPAERHKPFELEEFIAESFQRFSPWHKSQLRVIDPLQPTLRRIRRHMREAA